MDDQVLNRLHKAIVQYESGEVPKTFVQECFKFFHREIIDAELSRDADPDTQSDSNSMTLATSLETMNLLLKMVLILYDQYMLVSDLGSAAGSILAISTNMNSGSVMRSTRAGAYVTLGALRVSSNSSLHVQKSMLLHFQNFGTELGVLAKNITMNRNIDLNTCTYNFFDEPTPKYPVVLKIDSIELVKSLLLFWVSCVNNIIVKNNSLSCGTFHLAFLDTLLVIVENSVTVGLNLIVMSKIVECFNWQFFSRRYHHDTTLKLMSGISTWLDNVLQDLREGIEYDREDYRISFERFFEALSRLYRGIITHGKTSIGLILPEIYKTVKKHVVMARNVLLSSSRIIWRQILSRYICTVLPVIEYCIINDFMQASPTISFLMSCILDARTHHVVARCCIRLLQQVKTDASEAHMKVFFSTKSNKKIKSAGGKLQQAQKRRKQFNATSLEARLGLNDSEDSDDDFDDDGNGVNNSEENSEHVHSENYSGHTQPSKEIPKPTYETNENVEIDISTVEMEFKWHILIVEGRHEEITNSSDEKKWYYLLLCELSFHYGVRMLNIYQSIISSMIIDYNLKLPSSEVTKLNQSHLKQSFLICLASMDRSLLCMHCNNDVLASIKTVLSDIARTIAGGLNTFSKDDECSSAGTVLDCALPTFGREPSTSSINEKDCDIIISHRIKHYISTEDTLNLYMPLVATMIQVDENQPVSSNFSSSNNHQSNEGVDGSITFHSLSTCLSKSCKVSFPAALSNYAKQLFSSLSFKSGFTSSSSSEAILLDDIVLKLLSDVSNVDQDISNLQLLNLIEVISDTCILSTNVILSKFGCKCEILGAYSQAFKCSVHIELLNTDFNDMTVHQKLLYCQLFCTIQNSSNEFGLRQTDIKSRIFPESLQKFTAKICEKINKLWNFYSQFLCDFYLASAVPSTVDSQKQLIAVTTLIQQLRVLSSIINTILLMDSHHECTVGTKLDEHVESMLSSRRHTHYTHCLFGSIIAISLCEAQIYNSNTATGKDAKKMIFFVSKTLKTLVDHKLRQHKERRVRDEENMKEDALSWSIIPALGTFIRYTSFLWPGKALWGVTVLVDHWAALTNIHGDYEENLEEPLFLYYRLVEELTGLGDDDVSIILHLMVVQPMQACDRLIRRVIFKHENSHRIMNLFVRQILRINDKTQFNKAFLVPLTTSFLVEKDVKRYSNLSPFLNLKGSDRPLLTLLGETQHFYELLVSKAVEDTMTSGQMTEIDLVNGGFHNLLQGYTSAFKIPICQGDFIQSSVYQKLLLLLQWDLGSDRYIRLRAIKALRIICTLARAKSWSWEYRPQSVPKRPKQSSTTGATAVPIIEVSSNLDENVAAELSDNFLYTISHYLAYIQSSNTSLRSSSLLLHYLRFLQCLTELISPTDLVTYFPKIIFEIDRSLGSKIASVRLIGAEMVKFLMTKLPSDFIIANYPALIMTLFPIIRGESASSECRDKISDANDLQDDFIMFDALKYDTFEPHYLALQSSTKEDWQQRPPKLLRNCLTVYFHDMIESIDSDMAKKVAIETVVNSFKANISTYKGVISKIPSFPNIPEFRQIIQIHQNEKKKINFGDEVRNLCKLINHESQQVKLAALESLYSLCKENINQLYSVVSATAAVTAGSGLTSNASENIVSMILTQLMGVAAKASSQSSNVDIVNACARCFGEIGAIDSTRLSYFLPSTKSVRSGDKNIRGKSAQSHTSSNSSNTSSTCGKLELGQDIPPWQYSVTSFGLSLLETLVRILPEDGTDRTRVAIQEILKVIACEENPDDPDNLQLLLSRQSSHGSNKEESFIPQFLKEKLVERGILEICEPFWRTKYTIILGPSRKTFPLEGQNILLEFDAWVGFVCRYLSERCAGPYKQLFLACRGLVRSQTDICRFLLPHLLFDVMLFNPAATNITSYTSDVASPMNHAAGIDADKMEISFSEERTNAIECIIEEFTYVLQNQSDDVVTPRCKQLAIQVIFESTDMIRKWHSIAKVDFAKPRVESKHPSRREIMQKYADRCQKWPKVVESLKKLDMYIGMDLQAEAALRIGAYSRALRCFEMFSRESSSSWSSHNHNGTTVKAAKGSNNKDATTPFGDNRMGNQVFLETQDTIQVPKKLRNDGANHALPVLSARNLDLLMKILTYLDDPDGLDGVHIVRQVSGFSSTYWHRILEREHREDWLGALLEYEMAHHGKIASNIVVRTSGSVVKNITPSSGGTIRAHRNIAKITNCQHANNDHSSPKNENYKVSSDTEGERYLFDAAGRLKCLIELGQLNSALDQTVGMISNHPKLEIALIPRGVEASWKLLNWDSLDDFIHRHEKFETLSELSENPYSLEEDFQFSVGKLMLQVNNLDNAKFMGELKQARLESMSGLLASMESYGRAYPQLVQLHILSEIEHGFQVLSQLRQIESNVPSSSSKVPVGVKRRRSSGDNNASGIMLSGHATGGSTAPMDLFEDQNDSSGRITKDYLITSLNWDNRLEMLSTSLSSRKLVMAVRRSILAIGGMTDLVAKNWLHLSDLLQKSGKFEIAQIALRNAEASGLSKKQALLQECTILAKSGNVNRALSMLEPVEIDTAGLISMMDISKKDPKFVREKDELANQILLATKWMVESRHNLGNTIEERFKAVKELKGEWEDCLFEYGRFMEYRYHDAKSKESEGVSTSKQSNSSKNMKTSAQDTPTSNEYLRDTISLYAKALRAGTKYITQSLPRMLTLWFSSTMSDGCLDKNVRNDIQVTIDSIVPINDRKANARGSGDGSPIPAHVWFTCMPQLVSRAQHRDQYTAHTIKKIIIEIVAAHPAQGIWHVGGMLNSLNDVRQSIGQGIIKHAMPRLRDKNKGAMFDICQKLFKSLVDLAGADTGTLRRVTYNFPLSPDIAQILVPIKSALHVCIPEVSSESTEYFLSDQMYIRSFSNTVEVAYSKAKPKIVVVETTCGKKIKFLCKQEKNGDLRKDAHMMEINGVINRLLQEDPEGRKRCMRLRTFSVICLNEECGILEWVNNTSTMRSLIKESHSYFPEAYPFKDAREFQNDIKENQDKYWFDIETMTTKYNELVLSKYRPYFHRWFLEHFRDPTDWLDARLAFTRSTAIWAAVGHVVGLGDRHTENILIDTTNGELVHVDFDCLFDKGLLLQRAEIVPFRLTPNIVDAMGVCGIEGTFRKTMEVGVTLLRGNKDTLLSILEPFLRDPTVAWSRSGRAQQFQTHQQSKQVLKAGSERDNADAKEALIKISRRLDGVYNIYHPKAQDIKREFYSRYHRMPARLGLGGQIDDSLPLSVQGQVQRLIEEATDEANLAQMFLGWTSWL